MAHGRAIRFLDGGVIEGIDAQRWIRKPIRDSPHPNRKRYNQDCSNSEPVLRRCNLWSGANRITVSRHDAILQRTRDATNAKAQAPLAAWHMTCRRL